MTLIKKSEWSLLNLSIKHTCHSALIFWKKIVYTIEEVGFRELNPDVTETFIICYLVQADN